jgi:hypothetical protein
MTERILADKIHLLMEETGCDHGEAELALASTGYDLEKAVRTIAGQLRHIVVLKGKFQAPSRNLYGLVILIADTRRGTILRTRAVVSYNPALFETALEGDWYDVERMLYAYRLGEGTLQQVSQDLEKLLGDRWGGAEGIRFYQWLRDGDTRRILESAERLISAHFSGETVSVAAVREELNLDQYRRVRREDAPKAAPSSDGTGETLALKVSLEEDPEGVPAGEVAPGDGVHVLLTDERDIAQYLSKLLGGRSSEGVKALPAPVEGVTPEKDSLLFQVRLSGSVLGLAHVKTQARLKVDQRDAGSWWRRLNPFRA